MNNKENHMKKLIFNSIILLTIIFIFFACQKKEDSIKIGVAGPMTGDQAKMGTDFKNGIELAVKEWNEKGGIFGKKIVIIVQDDQHDPKQAVSVANKLVNEEVAGVIGHFNSNCSIPASDIYNRAGIPMISPGSTNPKLTEKGYINVFRVCGRDDQQGKVGAEFTLKKLNIKKAAVIHDKTTYGQGLADEFKKSIGNKIEIVYYGGIVQGDKDFKSILTTIKSRNPELIFFGGIYVEAGLLVRQAKELGIKAPFMSGDGTIDPKFIEIAGVSAAEGTYLTFSPDARKIPSAKKFVDDYEKKYGPIGPYSIYAYDAANILLNAIKETGTTEKKKVIEKLRSMNFSGALGKIKFDSKGDVTESPFVVWITKNGKFEELWKP